MCLYMYIYVQISSNEPNYRHVTEFNVDIKSVLLCVRCLCVCAVYFMRAQYLHERIIVIYVHNLFIHEHTKLIYTCTYK